MAKSMTYKYYGLVAASILTCVIFIRLPALTLTTDCGGNNAARASCQHYAAIGYSLALDDKNNGYAHLSITERDYIQSAISSHWIKSAHFLLLAEPWDEHTVQPIILCTKAYADHSRPWYRRLSPAPLAHAVGYAAGSSGLISPTEFAAVDASTYVLVPAHRAHSAPVDTK